MVKTSQKRSLTSILVYYLIVIGSVIAILTTFLSYNFLSHRSKIQYEKKLQEYLVYLQDSLELPIWRLDRNAFEKICMSFAKNDIVGLIQILDEDGDLLFEEGSSRMSDLIKGEAYIRHRNEIVGQISLGLIPSVYKQKNKELLLLSIFMAIMMILGLALSTKFVLKTLLKNPLDDLINRIQRIASGDYYQPDRDYKQKEIASISTEFNRMAEQVNSRERSLLNAKEELEGRTKELFKEKEFSEHIINSMPGIFFLYKYENDKLNLRKWNKNTEVILGFSKDELKKDEMESFFNEGHIPRLNEALNQISDKGSINTELEIRAKDGSLIPFYINAILFQNLDDSFIVGTGIDITEQNQFEKEKQELRVRLAQAQKMEAIGTLAGGIAHDFNNILSGIFGYSQLAQTNLDKPEKAKDQISQVIKGAQRATELVKQILTFSRQTEYQKNPFKIYLEVKEALKLLRSSIPSTIEIKTNLNSRAMVLADPTQIHQVIMNLCTNAYHAMRKTGGILTVSLKDVEMIEPKILRNKKIPPGKYLKLEVCDTGHGMDDETLEKVFDPYYTTKKIGQGTGLGLALVQAIVEEHDGFLGIETKPEKGTAFYIYFPTTGEKVESQISKEANTASLKGKETIMVVDDEEAIRQILKELLEEYQYQVRIFQNGVEALKEFDSNPHKFDLVITDQTMPGMTGEELSMEILNIRADIPIVLCTGFNEKISKTRALELGIRKYIKKPIANFKLLELIREILDKTP